MPDTTTLLLPTIFTATGVVITSLGGVLMLRSRRRIAVVLTSSLALLLCLSCAFVAQREAWAATDTFVRYYQQRRMATERRIQRIEEETRLIEEETRRRFGPRVVYDDPGTVILPDHMTQRGNEGSRIWIRQ